MILPIRSLALVAALLLVTGLRCEGVMAAHFSLSSLSWSATDIVVATEGATADGNFEVIEVLRGSLESGTELSVPRFSKPSFFRGLEVPRGGRMVFFLRKARLGELGEVRSSTDAWTASGECLVLSITWIRGDRLLAFLPDDPDNRGYRNWATEFLVILKPITTLASLRERIAECGRVRQPLTAIADIPDVEQRATKIVPYLKGVKEDHSHSPFVQREAFRVLTGCGAVAIPRLRSLLRDESSGPTSDGDILLAMASNDPEVIGPVFVDLLQEDLESWKALKGDPHRNASLKKRYAIGKELIRYLALMGFKESRETIERTREFWQSAPGLDESFSRSKMTKHCEAALERLDATAPNQRISNYSRRLLTLKRRKR